MEVPISLGSSAPGFSGCLGSPGPLGFLGLIRIINQCYLSLKASDHVVMTMTFRHEII